MIAPSPLLIPTPRQNDPSSGVATTPQTVAPEPVPQLVQPPVPPPSNLDIPEVADATGRGGASSRPLGWHTVGSTSHIARLSSSQAAEVLHRRSHRGAGKLRALPHTTTDAPKVLASAPVSTASACDDCAQANIKKTSHTGTLSAPAPEPGALHLDLKEMVVSIGSGFRYIVYMTDEHSRYVFYDFIKRKSEVVSAVGRCIAAFEATVGTPTDENGRALPRPRVRELHSDREGKLMSHEFKDLRAKYPLHHTVSPPEDHDLNPIAERIIGVISETATAVRAGAHAPPGFWPWAIAYAVDWHNASITSVGSSTADANLTPHQRFTLRPPRVMDLASFGCRAVVRKSDVHQHKPSLSTRGSIGVFLGRSRNSKGAYDVLVPGNRIITSSSVLVNEEYFDWAPAEFKHKPLTSISHARAVTASDAANLPMIPTAGSNVSAPSTFNDGGATTRALFMNLFSGPYARSDGLTAAMRAMAWTNIIQIDNSGELGGGWGHDIMNDSAYSELLAKAKAGAIACLMIAFPCSTFSIARFFDATSDDGGDRGPPIIRKHSDPDGLPEEQIDPKHIKELRNSNELLHRTVEIAIAARRSPARTTLIFENPADRSPGASIASAPEFAEHGSVFQTTPFKRLVAEADLTGKATFAYCRLGSEHQKYTTLCFTPEAGAVLDQLNEPNFQCNHERGSHSKRAGGRGANGEFVSTEAAAYPVTLCKILARAFTFARTGSESMPVARSLETEQARETTIPPRRHTAPPSVDLAQNVEKNIEKNIENIEKNIEKDIEKNIEASPARSPTQGSAPEVIRRSPVTFPSLDASASPNVKGKFNHGPGATNTYWQRHQTSTVGAANRPMRSTRAREEGFNYFRPSSTRTGPSDLDNAVDPLSSISEASTPNGTADDAYTPFDPDKLWQSADVMEAAVAASVYDARVSRALGDGRSDQLLPVSDWKSSRAFPLGKTTGKRLPGGLRSIEIEAELSLLDDDSDTINALLLALNQAHEHALRADSPDAPATHAEAMRRGEVWVKSESNELDNHKRNESWETITRDQLPAGRRVHKLIWVYKVKRDGTAKSRLCVQGSSLEAGVDYNQVFSAALRHSSARGLFAYAARNSCKVRSVDLVAAYLQGRFVDGEVVYCHLPPGYPEYDTKGRPKLAKVVKPIYGIQQSGRRLQRMLFEWFKKQGFVPLDDSDPCIFKLESPSGEIVTVGVYVDNLQIVHSAELDSSGRGPAGSAYNKFMDQLGADWEVTDEGPMDDLLGIEIDYLNDGSIKLHQTSYIKKIVSRFLPDGALPKAQGNSLPYSQDFLQHLNDALAQTSVDHPELVQPMQERVGCLMYATTATRPDIAYVVHQLCRCMHKPTPALLKETDHVLSYLSRTASIGLTYSREHARLSGFADASWETKTSTSGWVILWQSAALSWGSRKQKSIALSTCEAEIIALSEAAKDIVYLRKLVAGLDAREPGPSSLSSDSKSARDVSYNPEHHDRMKHVERRHFYVRDMVESFELEVPYVPTNLNVADFFTKPFKSASHFRELRKIVMNESD